MNILILFLIYLDPIEEIIKQGGGNLEYDRLVQLANSKIDQSERYELLKQAERILIDEMPIIPLYTYVRVYQLSGDVKGYYPNYLDHHHPKLFLFRKRLNLNVKNNLKRILLAILCPFGSSNNNFLFN